MMHNRHFSGQAIEAYIADGGEKFRKSDEKKMPGLHDSVDGNVEGEEGEDEGKRLDQFGRWLEEEGKKEREEGA